VLKEIKVRGGDGAERNTEIAHNGNRFQEDLWQKHSRAPVEIYAARMHFFHQ
jgi:hypothetical protein